MDKLWVALGAAAPLLVGLGWCIWLLVADARQERRRTRQAVRFAQRYRAEAGDRGNHNRPAHDLHNDDNRAVTVAELVKEARAQGEGIRLNWPEEDPDRARAMRPYVQDQFPTVVFGRVVDRTELDD